MNCPKHHKERKWVGGRAACVGCEPLAFAACPVCGATQPLGDGHVHSAREVLA